MDRIFYLFIVFLVSFVFAVMEMTILGGEKFDFPAAVHSKVQFFQI